MSILTRLFKSEEDVKTKSFGDASNGAIVVDMLREGSTDSVSATDAIKLDAFYTCVKDRAESIGQLPVKLYRENPDGTVEPIKSGREHRIFTQQPCDYMTMQDFIEMAVVSLDTHGAFYAYRKNNVRGNIMEIVPFANQGAVRSRKGHNGQVYYTYVKNDGKQVVDELKSAGNLFEIKGLTLDGYTPISPVRYNATLLESSKEQEESNREMQKNGIMSQMALSTDAVFTNGDSIARLKVAAASMRGSNGIKEVPVFENGVKPIGLKLSPKDAELLSSRTFTVNRICRMLRVPLERAGVMEKASSVSMNDIDEYYMRSGLNPTIVKFESAMNAMLPKGIKCRVDRKAFYAGSPWKMIEGIERELKGGLATVNEGRVDLGRDPVEGGEVFAVDNNNVTYGTWDELKEIQAQLHGERVAGNENNEKPPEEKPNEE